jgi:hypothetical protein
MRTQRGAGISALEAALEPLVPSCLRYGRSWRRTGLQGSNEGTALWTVRAPTSGGRLDTLTRLRGGAALAGLDWQAAIITASSRTISLLSRKTLF